MKTVNHPWQIILWAILMLLMNLSWQAKSVNAAEPEKDIKHVKGISSTILDCLTIGNYTSDNASGVVNLVWQGQVKAAELILSIAGTEAPHGIKVNGQLVAQVPIHAGNDLCNDEEIIRLKIPAEILVQGANSIEITNSNLADDRWSAAKVRLKVLGDLMINVPDKSDQIDSASISALAQIFDITFENSYDGSSQLAAVQIPDNYDGTPAPLLVFIHPRGGTRDSGINEFKTATNNRIWAHNAAKQGWLLASPELHGRWPIPPECFNDPNDCDYDDKILGGTTGPKAEPKIGAYAHASLESQYDALGTIKYMIDNFAVDSSRIYLVGYSMGAQGGLVTVAKSPHVFAAMFDNKGPSDMATWYGQQVNYYPSDNEILRATRKECYVVINNINTPAYPNSSTPTNPFCYQRRSGINFASNFIHTPISFTHSISDALVPISHSRNMRDAINGYGPDQLASLFEDTIVGPTCTGGTPPAYHCYEPDPEDVLDFLEKYTLKNNPTHINIVTDESKTFYWMKLNQSGSERFSRVEVTVNKPGKTVTAVISDTTALPADGLSLDFNLGDNLITEPLAGLAQPGMGLPENTPYLVKEQKGTSVITNTRFYTAGYFHVDLNSTGLVTVTISPVPGNGNADGVKVYLPIITKN